MINDDKLTYLIQEAKPLYKQRKRTKTIAKMTILTCLPVFMFTFLLQICSMGDNIYLSIDSNKLQNELLADNFGFLYTK